MRLKKLRSPSSSCRSQPYTVLRKIVSAERHWKGALEVITRRLHGKAMALEYFRVYFPLARQVPLREDGSAWLYRNGSIGGAPVSRENREPTVTMCRNAGLPDLRSSEPRRAPRPRDPDLASTTPTSHVIDRGLGPGQVDIVATCVDLKSPGSGICMLKAMFPQTPPNIEEDVCPNARRSTWS